jgi:hypothetical protein
MTLSNSCIKTNQVTALIFLIHATPPLKITTDQITAFNLHFNAVCLDRLLRPLYYCQLLIVSLGSVFPSGLHHFLAVLPDVALPEIIFDRCV